MRSTNITENTDMGRKSTATATGVLVVNKPQGVTSHDVVSFVRRAYGTRQVGHTGTLDPMATGVLPVLLGRAVKASEFVMAEEKEYIAELTLGVTTDTEDTTGNILSTCGDIPGEQAVAEACASFVGEILQTPPMYSALKVGGKKLYDLAREGVTVEREPRRITVGSIEPERISERVYRLRIVCSKGTYVRTLCADVGRRLGCGGAMSALCRTRTGRFTLDGAVTLDELEAMTPEERSALPLPTETLFEDLPAIELEPFFARLAKNGCEIYLKKIGKSYEIGQTVRMLADGEFFALGRVGEYPDGNAVKPVKLFTL